MSLLPLTNNTLNTPSDLASRQLAVDPKALDALRMQARNDPKGALKGLSSQFESLFLNTLMKQMRETSFDDSDNSGDMATYHSLLDEQMVQTMSQSGGVGIGAMLTRQIARTAQLEDSRMRQDGGRGVPTQSFAPGMEKALQAYRSQSRMASAPAAAPADQNSFVAQLLPEARSAAEKLGVAPELLVAQAALETGWGRKAMRLPDGSDSHNLFGIKAGSHWSGPTVNATTTEYVNGQPQKRVETFRAYGSYREALDDYAHMLAQNPRYRGALNQGSDGAAFAAGLQNGGYATDPAYARKLAAVAAGMPADQDYASSIALASR